MTQVLPRVQPEDATAPAVGAPARGTLTLAGASLGGRRVDVTVVAGRIARIEPAASGAADRARATTLDLSGFVLLPGLVEPHGHLDKAFTFDRVLNPSGDLPGAIAGWMAYWPQMRSDDIAARARTAALQYLASGTTTVQTHVDAGVGIDLRGIEALIAVREQLRDLLDLRLVACGSVPFSGIAGAANRALLEEAVAAGADAVGGGPALDEDPGAAIDRTLDLAARHGLPVDLHVDETLDPSILTLRLLIERVRSGFPHRVTASHCVSLGAQPPEVQQEIAEGLAETGIGIVTLPITNLYLQGRHPTDPAPRGLTAIHALLRAGVTVAAGGDNLRDPFNPMGRADPLEAASLLVTAGHLSPDAALHAVTAAARTVVGAAAVQPAPGDPADLVAVRAVSEIDAIASGNAERIVIRGGRVVARTTVQTEFPGWSNA